jgi:glycosyltransferase involved in cell wall biosynthesis
MKAGKKLNKTVSVIVPIYKVEDYLAKCIESILQQTYHDIEIILVDDGSPDNCGAICDNYAKTDSRIKVIHQKNGGLSCARNAGLDIATGDYIGFVDSDDWIDPDMFERLMQVIIENNADIVSCGLKHIFNDRIIAQQTDKIINYNNEEAIKDLLEQHFLRFEVWNKLYRKDIISELRFKPGQIHEDVYFTSNVFIKSSKIIYLDRPMYNYLQERYGNTNTYFKANKLAIFDEFKEMTELLENNNMVECARRTEVLCLIYILTFYFQACKNKNTDADIKKKLIDIFNEYYAKTKSNPFRRDIKTKLILFKLCPNAYIRLVTLRNKLLKK